MPIFTSKPYPSPKPKLPKEPKEQTGEFPATHIYTRKTVKKWVGILGFLLASGGSAGGTYIHSSLHSHVKEDVDMKVDVKVHERTAALEARMDVVEKDMKALAQSQKTDTQTILQAIQTKK